jgi:hypothetical protein
LILNSEILSCIFGSCLFRIVFECFFRSYISQRYPLSNQVKQSSITITVENTNSLCVEILMFLPLLRQKETLKMYYCRLSLICSISLSPTNWPLKQIKKIVQGGNNSANRCYYYVIMSFQTNYNTMSLRSSDRSGSEGSGSRGRRSDVGTPQPT